MWQILVESCLDHADIHDMTAWDSYCSRENEAAKTKRFSLFFTCIRAIINYNMWENTVPWFKKKNFKMAFTEDQRVPNRFFGMRDSMYFMAGMRDRRKKWDGIQDLNYQWDTELEDWIINLVIWWWDWQENRLGWQDLRTLLGTLYK